MAYITNSDIELRLGSAAIVQLADDDGNGVADVAVVDEARRGAQGEVDSYLARRFAVPIDLGLHPAVAGVLKSFALDLAEYRLRSRRPPIPSDAIERHAKALAWLGRVATGEVELPLATDAAPRATGGDGAVVTGGERILTDDELDGF